MPSLDVFNNDAFSMMNLTASLNLAPHKPKLLGGLKLFKQVPIYETKAMVESREGKLSILNTAPRGTMKDVRSADKRKARNFNVPHVPLFQSILADDILGKRAFGSETELEVMSTYVNDQLIGMREDHEATHEFHRVGALKGIVYDGDNSTVIYNYYTEFGTSQQTSNFVFTVANFTSAVASPIIRLIADAIGNDTFELIIALCGNTYFDQVCAHASNIAAYDRWRDGQWLRETHLGPEWYSMAPNGFMLQNILFLNYRGVIGDVTFIPATEAYYFPVGVPNMFQEIVAPADFMETVNTKGKLLYAKQEPMPMNKGVTLHTQSNALYINTRPRAVVKSTYSAS